MNWFYRQPRLTMSELRAKVERQTRKPGTAKSRRTSKRGAAEVRVPVRVKGHTIATSFWGLAWCRHLESYSDFESRLGRGRSYLYAGAVLDLRVGEGRIEGQVQGSSLYRQTIEVEVLAPARRAALGRLVAGKIESLVALLRGQLPESLARAMTDPGHGLFPAPEQIQMRCTCPDRAALCKHLAAVLYGFAARLDSEPELLFRLRGVAIDDLVQHAEAETLRVQEIAADKQARGDLAALFDIDLVEPRSKEVTREHLKVLGIPARTIDKWLREGVLIRTPARAKYRRSPEADRRIADMLAR